MRCAGPIPSPAGKPVRHGGIGSSALAESIKSMMAGESEGDADALGDLVSLKGVVKYPVRIKCALLGWNTLLEALEEKAAT